MHKRIYQLMALLMIAALVLLTGCGGATSSTPKAADNSPYVIGFLSDVSGHSSSLGMPEQKTAQMLQKQFNDAGGINGHPVKIVMYDSKSDVDQAVLSAKQLIQQDKAIAIVGGTMSSAAMAISKLTENEKIPFIAMGAEEAITTPVRPYTFKAVQGDIAAVGNLFQNYIIPNNFKNIAVVSMNDQQGNGGRDKVKKFAAENGMKVVSEEILSALDTDFTAQLLKVRDSRPDVLIIWSRPPSASIVGKQARQLGLNMPILQSHGCANQAFIDQLGPVASEGVILPSGKSLIPNLLPDSDPQKKALLDFANDYKAFTGEGADTFGGYAWDGIMMIANALKAGATTSEDIRNYLENNVKNFVGVSGIFNMSPQDHNGLKPDSMATLVIKSGKWTIYQK